MDNHADTAAPEEAPESPRRGSASGDSPAREVRALLHDASAIGQQLFELLGVEARLFGRALVLMLMLAVALALLLVTAWLFVIGSVALTFSRYGTLPLPLSLLAVALLNLVLAAAAWLAINRLSLLLAFREFAAAVRQVITGHDRNQQRKS